MALAGFEDELSAAWPRSLDGDEGAFRVTSAFGRVMQKGIEASQAEVALIDVGPSLGALDRAALLASNDTLIPLGPDFFSLQGLRNMGPILQGWRRAWQARRECNPIPDSPLPAGGMEPMGYILMRHAVRRDAIFRSDAQWTAQIPGTFRECVLGVTRGADDINDDPHCLGLLKHYRGLMPMAQEARKPIFYLKPADGALGAHANAVQDAYRDFRRLAQEVAHRVGLPPAPAVT